MKFVFVKKQIPRSQATRVSRYKCINWNEYNRSLKLRGSITVWMNPAALNEWYYKGKSQRGAQYHYSAMCIQLCLIIRKVYHLPLRQTEGFVRCLFQSAGIKLKVPDYTIICRRAKGLDVDLGLSRAMKGKTIDIAFDTTGIKVYGEGEWKVRQHGWNKYRTWRKLHLGIDPSTGLIYAEELTLNSSDDSSMVKTLLSQIGNKIKNVLADGSYDTRKALDEINKKGIHPIVPPRKSGRIKRKCPEDDSFFNRNAAIRTIRKYGLKKWKKLSGYHKRSTIETTMFRYKTTFGDKFQSREFERQKTESKIACYILNTMLTIARPITVKN